MRAVVQRVTRAHVSVESEVVGRIGPGLCVLLGVGARDAELHAEQLAQKLCRLRIFQDAEGKMNLSVVDVGGGLLLISQFTLWADLGRGRRPSFVDAMEPGRARELFDCFAAECRKSGLGVEVGRFGASMQVELVNDGPVTLWLDTDRS